ncbi:MAG: hypothetical protein H6843_07140 [Rhodospirillaceae bacterium]|nr:hypothetical protein [Rhodospirillaceae bacterium]
MVKLPNGLEARYFMSVDAILSVENGAQVRKPATCWRASRGKLQDARHHRRSAAGGRAVRGPRRPKDYAIISEIDGRVEFGRDYKTKRRIVVAPREEAAWRPANT